MYDQQLGIPFLSNIVIITVVMYKWLHMRKEMNKPIPETQDEMKDMMSRDRTGVTMKDIMKLNPSQSKYKSGKQRLRM